MAGIIKRLWLVLSLLWAGCCIMPELFSSYPPPVWRTLFVGFLPLIAGAAMGRMGHFVARGN
jgi:hypothetical protein